MTTTTAAVPSTGEYRPTFFRMLRSEWIKLRSLRSTWWCFAIILVLPLGLAVLSSLSFASMVGTEYGPPADMVDMLPLQMISIVVFMSQLVAAVQGVLIISGEYSTGMIRSTLTAVPSRTPVLLAKGLVFFVVTFVVVFITTLLTEAVSILILNLSDLPVEFTGELLLATLAASGYVALVGLFALGLGTILRSSAGGIAASIGLLLVLPTVVAILGMLLALEWLEKANAYLLQNAGQQMFAVGEVPEGALTQWQSALVVLAWVAVAWVIALVLLKKRDA